MPLQRPQLGIHPRKLAPYSPIDILRSHLRPGSTYALAQHADPRIAGHPTLSPLPTNEPSVSDHITRDSRSIRGTASGAEPDHASIATPTTLADPSLYSDWSASVLQELYAMSAKGNQKVDLITFGDAQRSRAWSCPTSRNQNDEIARQYVLAHDVHFRQSDHSCVAQHGAEFGEDLEFECHEKAAGTEGASGKRIASFQSSSDASTRRSSIWDDDYDGEVEDDDASDVTDMSESDDENHCDVEQCSPDSQHAAESFSQLGYSDHELDIPKLEQSKITVPRSPKRRRSSHPALLLLQAENSHLQAERSRVQEENVRLLAANAEFIPQNTSLGASLGTTTKSLATAQDTISTQDLQLHSLRRRVSFLERWVDSLHEEKVALHEENVALRGVGSARAQAVEDLRKSYEKLEVVIEKAVGMPQQHHDCLLEAEVEGVRGRLGDLRIVS